MLWPISNIRHCLVWKKYYNDSYVYWLFIITFFSKTYIWYDREEHWRLRQVLNLCSRFVFYYRQCSWPSINLLNTIFWNMLITKWNSLQIKSTTYLFVDLDVQVSLLWVLSRKLFFRSHVTWIDSNVQISAQIFVSACNFISTSLVFSMLVNTTTN